MAKPASMAEKMRAAKNKTAPIPESEANKKTASDETTTKGYVAPSRKNKKSMVLHFEPEAMKQVKRIAYEEEKTIQALGVEAINLLFASYDLPQIAE